VREWLKKPKTYVRRVVAKRMALWAWFSCHPETVGGRMAVGRWEMRLTHRNAQTQMRNWYDRLDNYLDCGWGAEIDVWFEEKSVNGFDFVAIRTPEELLAEGASMKHCIATYGSCIRDDRARVWRVMKAGKTLANFVVEVPYCTSYVIPGEIWAKLNRRVPDELAEAAMIWFMSHPPKLVKSRAAAHPGSGRNSLSAVRWQELFKPYWIAKRTIPAWLPMVPVGDHPMAIWH
jgi:hypothetical protein